MGSAGVAFVLAITSILHAQATTAFVPSVSAANLNPMLQAVETTTPQAAESVPSVGTFWSAQNPNWPPLPSNINNLDAWNLGNGVYMLDDFDFDYQDQTQSRAMATGVPSPGDDGYGDGGGYTSSYVPCTFDTNNLWLEITNVANGLAYLNLHNSTNQIYAIWSASNLLAEWNVETEVWPDTNQNQTVTPFTVPTLERQNLFVRAQDWTDVLGDGGIPLWWYWLYFGRTDLLATNLNSVGSTLLFDYTNNFDPNILVFSIVVTNQYVNTSSPVLPLILGGGSAFDMAVLVNDANHADAVWQPFNSNVVVNLNGGDGGYDVRVGLRKSPANTNQVWDNAYVHLILDTVPPLLVVTNPMPGMVSQSPIQLQGYANEPLSGLTFDVSNATGIFTNQTGYLTGLFYDDNLSAYTTNYFQCPDIGLGNGTNFITLHATDLAGNTANVSLMLDYVPNNNSPVLNVIWPLDGAQISDNNFTVQAQTDDNTSTVMAVITDSNGNTNTVSGLVEQNGTIWVQNLPLAAGANQLTLTVENASASSTTNLTVYQSGVLVTVAPLTADQLNQTSIAVTGTISEPGDTVTVNGVQATVDPDDGTWEAEGVPVSAYGTAIIDVEVYAGNTSNFAHNNLRFTPLDGTTAGNSIGSHISNQTQPVAVKMASYFARKSSDTTAILIYPDFMNYEGNVPVWYPGYIYIVLGSSVNTANWAVGVGGTQHFYGCNDELGYFDMWNEIGPTQSDQSDLGVWGGLWSGWESADDSGTYSGNSTGIWSKTSRTQVVIAPAGQEPAGQTNSYLVLASALEVADGMYSGNGVIPLPPEWLQINGQPLINSGITNDDSSVSGAAIVQALAGTTTNITPVATQHYNYNDILFNNQVFQLISQCVATTPSNQARTNLGVCEQVNLYFNPALPTTNVTWSATAGGLAVTSGITNLFTASDNATNVTVTATVGSMPVNFYFKVFAPTGVVFVKLGEKHTQGSLDAGFHAQCILSPTNVSFYNIEISEMNATYTGSGCFAFINGQIHKTWIQQGVGWLTPGQNNYLNPEVDYTYLSAMPPAGPGPGTDSCPIPWNYREHGTTNDGYNFATLTSSAIATTNVCTKSKNGMSSTSFNISDPTVNW